MGFSIGRFLGSIARTVVSAVPIIGPAVAEVAFPSRLASVSRPPVPFQVPMRVSQAGPIPVAFPVGTARIPLFDSRVGPTVRPVAAGALVPLAGAARGLIAALLGRASAAVGTRITRERALSLVRDLGLAAAAAALGLTAIEIAQIIASRPRRRRRGITAAQIATTKATIRRMDSINRAIAQVCPPARRRPAPRRRISRVHPAVDV